MGVQINCKFPTTAYGAFHNLAPAFLSDFISYLSPTILSFCSSKHAKFSPTPGPSQVSSRGHKDIHQQLQATTAPTHSASPVGEPHFLGKYGKNPEPSLMSLLEPSVHHDRQKDGKL